VDDEHRRIGAMEPGSFQRLQAFEDAIAYRRARITAPCPDCGTSAPSQQCEVHARDLDLIKEYLETHHRTAAALRAQTERQRRRQLTSPGPPARSA
jgi:hypothetical protein